MNAPDVDQEQPVSTEVVGLPGSGKTSLVERLPALADGVDIARRPGRLWELRAYIGSGLVLAPVVVRRLATSSGSWAEVMRMLKLDAWLSMLHYRSVTRARALVLDQGPVYLLHRLGAEGLDASSVAAAAWHDSMMERCARSLGAAIALDAPNEVLIQRIRDRSKVHRLRHQPRETAWAALTDQRERLRRLLDQLQARGLPKVLWIDTSGAPLDRATLRTLQALGIQPPLKANGGFDPSS